jgi:hypothetical protein
VLLLLENAPLREAADIVTQPWFKLYHFLSTWRSDIDMDAWVHSTKGLAAHPQGFQRQLDAVAALRPEHVAPTHWSMLVEDRLRQAVRSGYHWEELLSSWVALYCKVAQHLHTALTAADAGKESAAAAADADLLVQLPEFDAFLLHMFALESDPQAQLDFVTGFKPPAMSQANWDTEIGKVRRGGGVTRRHVGSQQEWHCLPGQEATARDHCVLQKGTPPAAKAATSGSTTLYQWSTWCSKCPTLFSVWLFPGGFTP